MDERELMSQIAKAGDVPPPPDREGAFERAMAAVTPVARRRGARPLLTLLAAALLAIPTAALVGSVNPDAEPPEHKAPAIRSENPTPAPSASTNDDRSGTNDHSSDDDAPDNSGRGSSDGKVDEDRSGSDEGPEVEETSEPEPEGSEEPDAEETPDEPEADSSGSGSDHEPSPTPSAEEPEN